MASESGIAIAVGEQCRRIYDHPRGSLVAFGEAEQFDLVDGRILPVRLLWRPLGKPGKLIYYVIEEPG